MRALRERAGRAFAAAALSIIALAAALKRTGGTTWLGMSRSVRSLRAYALHDFWCMVSRSAFTQLRY